MANAKDTIWTPELKATAKSLYIDQNKSASITAGILGVSRNAVIGIINRMGFRKDIPRRKPKAPLERKPYKRARTAAERVEKRAQYQTPILISGEDIPPLLASVKELSHWSCAYPYGLQDYQFCGRPKTRGAFCSQHAQLCYADPIYGRHR